MRYPNLTPALFGAALILFSASGHATENGAPTTPAGLYDFGAGFTPPPTPTGTFGIRTAYYSANALKDGSGNDQPVAFSLDVLSVGLAYLRMTEHELWGARYGWGAVLPFFAMDASLEVPTPFGTFSDSAEVLRQADLQVLPLILQWNPSPNLGINTQFQIQAPTGDYDEDRLVSPGLNHWAFSPILNAPTFPTAASRSPPVSSWTSTPAIAIPTTAAAWSIATSLPWASTSIAGRWGWAVTTTASSPMTRARA